MKEKKTVPVGWGHSLAEIFTAGMVERLSWYKDDGMALYIFVGYSDDKGHILPIRATDERTARLIAANTPWCSEIDWELIFEYPEPDDPKLPS